MMKISIGQLRVMIRSIILESAKEGHPEYEWARAMGWNVLAIPVSSQERRRGTYNYNFEDVYATYYDTKDDLQTHVDELFNSWCKEHGLSRTSSGSKELKKQIELGFVTGLDSAYQQVKRDKPRGESIPAGIDWLEPPSSRLPRV